MAVAARLMADRGTVLDTLAREELGIDPESLGGSAGEAAATSFVLFAAGAVIPVLPFLILTGAAAVALFAVGAGITLLTGRGVLFSGARQVLFGLAAAGLTFGSGRLIGVPLSGWAPAVPTGRRPTWWRTRPYRRRCQPHRDRAPCAGQEYHLIGGRAVRGDLEGRAGVYAALTSGNAGGNAGAPPSWCRRPARPTAG